MYDLALILHNLSRWPVLFAAAWVLWRSWQGLRAKRYGPADRRAGMVYTGLMDLQLVLGVALFVVSPFIQGALGNLGAAMQSGVTRFFIAEHWVGMLLALALAHVGSARVRRAADDALKHRQALLWYGLSLALVLLSIPWWRPLLRLG